jgi:putative lipoic acid-binding regulatory protein
MRRTSLIFTSVAVTVLAAHAEQVAAASSRGTRGPRVHVVRLFQMRVPAIA